jgi:hypothetical protein
MARPERFVAHISIVMSSSARFCHIVFVVLLLFYGQVGHSHPTAVALQAMDFTPRTYPTLPIRPATGLNKRESTCEFGQCADGTTHLMDIITDISRWGLLRLHWWRSMLWNNLLSFWC